jgi:hypothetical protein
MKRTLVLSLICLFSSTIWPPASGAGASALQPAAAMAAIPSSAALSAVTLIGATTDLSGWVCHKAAPRLAKHCHRVVRASRYAARLTTTLCHRDAPRRPLHCHRVLRAPSPVPAPPTTTTSTTTTTTTTSPPPPPPTTTTTTAPPPTTTTTTLPPPASGSPTASGTAPQPVAGRVMLGLHSWLSNLNLTPAQSIPYREAQVGRTFEIGSHYYDWTDPFPGAAERADTLANRIPMVTWWGTNYAAINNGSQDALILERATAVKAYGQPIFIRWAAEMNGDWYAWCGPQNGNDPGAFVQAWRRIHSIFSSAGVTNVAWVWAPNADSKPGGTDLTSWNNWRNYYPGDAYVDWVGVDGYNWGSEYSWQSFDQVFGPVYSDYAGRKPIMIAETNSAEAGGDKATWIDDAVVWIKGHPGIAALIWYDVKASYAGSRDWRIDSSAPALAAFKRLSSDPYFGG